MKGLTLNVIVALIIALVGVAVLLSLMSGALPNLARRAYCRAYLGVVSVLPSPPSGSPTIPAQCRILKVKEEIIRENNETAAREIAAYSLACWEEVDKFGIQEDRVCYKLTLKGNIEVNETAIREILREEGGCEIFPTCGVEELEWLVSNITLKGGDLVLIQYNKENDVIQIVA